MKLCCACERDGWGRLSDDGSGHYNPDPSEGLWGGGPPTLQAAHDRILRPDSVRDHRSDHEMREGRRQTSRQSAHAGSRLKLMNGSGKVSPERPAFQPYRGKPAVRNDRGDRGDVGIIRSPVRASIPPDCGGRLATTVPTANGDSGVTTRRQPSGGIPVVALTQSREGSP